MSLKEVKNAFDKPISEWPVFYKDGLPFIYDDEHLFFDERGNHLAEHPRHTDLGIRLRLLLEWQYEGQNCSITIEITFRASVGLAQTGIASANAVRRGYVDITPDLAVLKGVTAPDSPTYYIGPGYPPPAVVIEIGSPSTYTEDLGNKFLLYEQVIQAQEYIAYDPHRIRLWDGPRLKGWQLVNGRYQELRSNEQGWLWSEELQSWLVEDGQNLQLYDAEGNRRLTKTEYLDALVQVESARANQASTRADEERLKTEQTNTRAEQERARANQATGIAELERARAEEAIARAELERARAETEKARAQEANIRAETEKARVQEANTRAELEKARTQEANIRAETEKTRADQLAARLIELEAQLGKLDKASEN